MKTPAEMAFEALGNFADARIDGRSIHLIVTQAIEADRAQRVEPVDPDWQDDADMYRDAAAVDISWRAWDASGRQIGYSDASINGAQAAAMFEAIGRTV